MTESRLIKPPVMVWLLVSLFLLNLADTVSTMVAVQAGLAEEVNPLMDYLLQLNSWLFFGVKMIVIVAAMSIFYMFRQQPAASYGVMFIVTLYSLIGLVHITGLLTTLTVFGI